ncbi:MAG TPA: WD40 repeat domain-containing serine/threonine-protein kinase, partial [Ktedonobacteraceae bacterium]|nr:WD40 repeat domain-containing serine/threonine-protein kinase [Ktedonobacteraceae bacterium]
RFREWIQRGVALMVASAHLHCARCGTDNPALAAFCFACGEPFLNAAVTTNSFTGSLAQNHLLKERYRILEQVGKGGFGAVYKAADTLFGYRLVAIKEMEQSRLSPQEMAEAIEAFKREAHLLACLQHPNIPAVYDYFGEAGRWYLVMDFIAGVTLEDYLRTSRGGYLPVEKVLDLGVLLCTVLDYLHTRQPPIIFRDLKPANILVTASGRIYLIDFGIARHFKPGQVKDTVAFGSPGYAPPEQYGRTQTTPRADVYALGATLHQLLTGDDPTQTPFRFAPLQLRSQTTPVGLDTLVASMLEIDEKRRPASMDTVKRQLQRFVVQRTGAPGGTLQPGTTYAFSSTAVPRHSFPASQVRTGPASVGSILVEYYGHADRVNAVAWSPDGTQVVSAGDDLTAQVWEFATGDHRFSYTGHTDRVNAVAWSPDGKLVASASSDATVQVWEADSGIYRFSYTGHTDRVHAVAWSPGGTLVASGGDDKTVRLWDATTGHHLFTYRGHSDWVRALAWSPDGRRIASVGDDSTLHVWDAVTRRALFLTRNVYRGASQRIRTVAWSPDGKLVASAGDDKTVHIWIPPSRKPALIYRDHADGLHAVAWSPDGKYLASAAGSSINYYAENTVRIWNAASGETLYTFRSQSGYIRALAWSPDGQCIASASSDHSVAVWRAR